MVITSSTPRDPGEGPSPTRAWSSAYLLNPSTALKISFPVGWRFDEESLRSPPATFLRGQSAALMLFAIAGTAVTSEQLVESQPAAFVKAGGSLGRKANIDCPNLGTFSAVGIEFAGTVGPGRDYFEICGAIADNTPTTHEPRIHLLKLCVANLPPRELQTITDELRSIWRSLQVISIKA